ncbi:MAG: hypothetical protein ACFFDM_10160, partial [Candidatus Thorarchaeota archaeon]
MTETENETIELEAGVVSKTKLQFQRIHHSVVSPLKEFAKADRSGKVDMLGKGFLLIPAFASILIIVLILAFLWSESVPIFVAPEGGPGIIVSPSWDPSRDLYGIAIFVVGSLLCT